jgi:Gly-Xaa carboxypeptidase
MRSIAHVVPALIGFGIPSAMSLSIPSPQQILNSWSGTNNICPLAPKVGVPEDGLLSALRFVQDESIRLQQVDRLSRAVQVPTTVNDYMTDPFDEGFAPFVEFQALLETLFPLM